jgi:transcriptional regulator with XRE-family HTH domain
VHDEISQLIDRIKRLMEHHGDDTAAFARRIGVPYGALQPATGPRGSKPSAIVLQAIARRTTVAPAWLLTGEGPMLRGDQGKGDAMEVQQGESAPGELAALRRELAAKDKLIGYLEQDKERLEHQVAELREELERAKALQKTGSG